MNNQTSLAQKPRVWEIDALRGFLTLGILLFHLYFTLDAFFVNGYYKNIDTSSFLSIMDPFGIFWAEGPNGKFYGNFLGQYFDFINHSGVNLFFIISGISCLFSRDNLRSGIRLLFGAAYVSFFTKLLALYTGEPRQFIRFGALHCYAACHLIYYFFLEERNDKTQLSVSVFSLLAGYYIKRRGFFSEYALLVPFGIRENGVSMRDYWPIFPMLGWFLIGVLLGRRWYSEKKSRFPNIANKKWHIPLRFLGRNSGLIYCGHMVVYTVVFCGIGYIFDLY